MNNIFSVGVSEMNGFQVCYSGDSHRDLNLIDLSQAMLGDCVITLYKFFGDFFGERDIFGVN